MNQDVGSCGEIVSILRNGETEKENMNRFDDI